jgi:outer membrane protein
LKRILLYLLILSCAHTIFAQTHLTFDGALGRALLVSNSVERSRTDIVTATAQKSYLLSAVLPRIDLNGDVTRNSIEQRFGEGDDSIAILPQNDWSYRLTLNQPLYAGGRELRAYSQAKINIDIAREASFGTEDAVLLGVASNYLAVVNADRKVEVEKKNIELAEKRLAQAQAFYEEGEVTKVDVLRAQTSIRAAQRMLAFAAQEREHAVADLRTNLDLDGPIDVETPGRQFPGLPTEEELIERAVSSRPDVVIAENNLRVAQLEVAKQRGFWLPTVRFEGGFVQQKTPFPTNEYAYGRLNFHVPIFQSGEVQARVAGAKSEEKDAEYALEEARIAAREDVRRALADLHAAQTSLQLATEQLEASQLEYDQSFELYRAQESTSLDLSASENALAISRRTLAEETLNRALAELRVWYAAGSIKHAVGVTAPTEEPVAPKPE